MRTPLVGPPMPELDLSRIQRPSARLPYRVLSVLADGIDPADAESAEWTAQFSTRGDDDEGTPVSRMFYRRANGERVEVPMRKMREAWPLAVARGVVPASWIDPHRRLYPDQEVRFFCDACKGYGAVGWDSIDCAACDGRGSDIVRKTVPVPGNLEWMWMLGCPELVLAAEDLAREAVQRLDGAPKPETVQWGRYDMQTRLAKIPPVIVSAVAERARVQHADYAVILGPAFEGAEWWSIAKQRLSHDTRQILARDVADAWACRAKGETASAFEPVLRLWELGFLVEEIREDAVVLERAVSRPIT